MVRYFLSGNTVNKQIPLRKIPYATKKYHRKRTGSQQSTSSVDPSVYVTEGYATAFSVSDATGAEVVVAFDAGNVLPVAKAIRAKYPQREIIIAGDNNEHADGSPNTGKEVALKAGEAIGANVSLCPLIDGQKADFNDLHQKKGLDAVRKALKEFILIAKSLCPTAFLCVRRASRRAYSSKKSTKKARRYRFGGG